MISITMKYYARVDASQRVWAAAAVDGLIAKAGEKVVPGPFWRHSCGKDEGRGVWA